MYNTYNWYSHRPLTQKQINYRAAMAKREAGRREAADKRRKAYLDTADNLRLFARLNELAPKNQFAQSMVDAINHYGSLTENQQNAVKRMIERETVRAEQRREENAQAAEVSQHVGNEKERREFTLTLDRAFGFNGKFGYTYGHVLHDADGNVFIYFGKRLEGQIYSVDPGDKVVLKATIKRHDQRDGVKQTVLSRPVVLDVIPGNDREPNDDLTADIQRDEEDNYG